MQFKYLTKEENIKCYTISNDKIALLLKDGSFYYDNENLVRAVDGFFFHDNFLYYSQDGVSTIILNTRTKERTNIPKIFSSDSVEANSFLIGNNYERFGDTLYYSAEIELYQLNPYKLINRLAKRYIFSKYIRRNNYLFTEKFKTILSSLSLLTGEYEWEIDLGGRYYLSANEQQEVKISQIIGIIDDKLYVWMNDDRLVVLAIATGTILSETFPLQNFKDNRIVKYVLLPQYRESEQSVLFFYQDFLVTIHLPTHTTSLVWQDERYNIGSSFITDQCIYFIGSCEKGALFRDHIGVFDREKNEVVWMQRVITLSKETYNSLREIQASTDKIYVLDTEGTLYIFEKEG